MATQVNPLNQIARLRDITAVFTEVFPVGQFPVGHE
jgi:hypothetical protein